MIIAGGCAPSDTSDVVNFQAVQSYLSKDARNVSLPVSNSTLTLRGSPFNKLNYGSSYVLFEFRVYPEQFERASVKHATRKHANASKPTQTSK